MEELKQDLKMAFSGREYWIRLKEKYEIDENYYLILCPTSNFLLNKIAMENLRNFLKRKFIQQAIVLSVFSKIEELCPYSTKKDIQFKYLGQEEMDLILKYYRLLQFFKNIVVISLEEPFGNENIIGKKGISLEDYVKDAIYV